VDSVGTGPDPVNAPGERTHSRVSPNSLPSPVIVKLGAAGTGPSDPSMVGGFGGTPSAVGDPTRIPSTARMTRIGRRGRPRTVLGACAPSVEPVQAKVANAARISPCGRRRRAMFIPPRFYGSMDRADKPEFCRAVEGLRTPRRSRYGALTLDEGQASARPSGSFTGTPKMIEERINRGRNVSTPRPRDLSRGGASRPRRGTVGRRRPDLECPVTAYSTPRQPALGWVVRRSWEKPATA